MPNFHGSLTNEDFVLAMNIARLSNMELKEFVSKIVFDYIHNYAKEMEKYP